VWTSDAAFWWFRMHTPPCNMHPHLNMKFCICRCRRTAWCILSVVTTKVTFKLIQGIRAIRQTGHIRFPTGLPLQLCLYLAPFLSATRTVWVGSKKAEIKTANLLAEHEKFVQHVTVSAGMYFGGKGRLHFVDESTKLDSAYYVGHLLRSVVNDWTRLLPSGNIFQQITSG